MTQRHAFSMTVGVAVAAGLAGGLLIWQPVTARAMADDPPSSNVDCRKRKNKNKPECRNQQNGGLSDEQVYQAGYWLAQRGNYEEALAILKTASNANDPKILNYIGFVKRKLGHVHDAVSYYRRALTINPDYTVARAYFGEALLQMGRLDRAKHQLDEIYRRCGKDCAEYDELSQQIANYQKTPSSLP